MKNKKILGILIISVLIAGVSFSINRCYNDNDHEARVTIHFQRNDFVSQKSLSPKKIIDMILESIGTPAYAVIGWSNIHGDLTLKVTSPSFSEMTYAIPASAVTYTLTVPASVNVTFEITSFTLDGDVSTNWGGHTTQNLLPGEQNIEIKMIPMTQITSAGGSTSLDVYWESTAYVTSYKIYRSNNASGPFTLIGTGASAFYSDSTASMGVTYYYRVSIVNSNGEGLLCPPYSGMRI